jgi:hypothetical protein
LVSEFDPDAIAKKMNIFENDLEEDVALFGGE